MNKVEAGSWISENNNSPFAARVKTSSKKRFTHIDTKVKIRMPKIVPAQSAPQEPTKIYLVLSANARRVHELEQSIMRNLVALYRNQQGPADLQMVALGILHLRGVLGPGIDYSLFERILNMS
jgi:hypothetical protein